jgi:hypothetical protein
VLAVRQADRGLQMSEHQARVPHMTDIMHALTQLPFVAGFIAGAVIWFFIGLAIGWSRGNASGWHDGWHDARGE